jgi:hypothetical protein
MRGGRKDPDFAGAHPGYELTTNGRQRAKVQKGRQAAGDERHCDTESAADRRGGLRRRRLIVLCHKLRRMFLLYRLAQYGHLGSILAIATIS